MWYLHIGNSKYYELYINDAYMFFNMLHAVDLDIAIVLGMIQAGRNDQWGLLQILIQ